MANSRRMLTAVMFTDVVGYSAMVNRDERTARELVEMQRRLLRRQLSAWRGKLIDTIGDGTLAIFDSALDAAECAVAIQDELRLYNASRAEEQQLRLRIGLHQGDVERGNGGVFGDGVNVCSRLEPLSPPGGIAASGMVVAQIHGPLRDFFWNSGAKALKNIPEPVEVHELPEDALEAAATTLGPPPNLRTKRRNFAAGVAAAVLLLVAAACLIWWRSGPQLSRDDASLAVLPLENMATEPGSAEFVAGLHDNLITEIARAPHLKVISRTSVMRYATQKASIPEVAKLLGVANVLEGSIQRSGSRIRVNVQLIRAATDEHLWAEVYDREVADLFELQTEIAREIARKIRGNLALPAMPASERPTNSAEAYELYLRAISHEETDPALGASAPDEPLRLLERAVALDPSFALAHAAIARYAAWGALWASYRDLGRMDGYVERAVQAANRAMELKPKLPESLLGYALARYWKDRDPVAAEKNFTRALEQRPGYPAALYMLSGTYEALGNLDRAADTVRALLDVDPANEKALEQLSRLLTRLRQFTEAEQVYQRWQQLSRNRRYVDYLRAQFVFSRSGDIRPWKKIVNEGNDAALPPLEIDRWVIALCEGRFDDAAAVALPLTQDFMHGRSEEHHWSLYAGQALVLGGKQEQARPYLEKVVAHLQRLLKHNPADRYSLDFLGLAQTMLGESDAALANLNRSLEIRAADQKGQPTFGYYEVLLHRAQAAAFVGRKPAALADLERLLREPSGQYAAALRHDPFWGPLQKDPDFLAMLQRYQPRD